MERDNEGFPGEAISNPHGEAINKLRLNAEQWQMLQALAACAGNTSANARVTAVGRLTSHGLVAMDDRGCAYLTIVGLQRLDQGR
ncbi:hypothetical protein WKW77_29335 [Variovorax ureilyticus]|uniref:MarR family protein n=1 Tax=Variovorax ureilyticus TaxID=1836198 RepID=A0ABU8VNI4_9BURK